VTFAALFVAATLHASDLAAQACLGLPSFVNGAVHLNVAAEFPDSASAFAIGVGAGRHNNLFGNLGGGQVTYEGLTEKSTLGFLELGYQVPLSRAQLCPIVGGYFGVGPDEPDFGVKVTSRSASAGIALGLPISVNKLTVIPNAAVKYDYVSVKFEEEGADQITESATGGIVDLGLGLVLSDRFSIQPLAHIPFGGDDGEETTFGVFASFSFGWRVR
jgi:hypothetical protein